MATILYVCYLNASKAFDRVDYSVLFRKLINRGIPGYIVRLYYGTDIAAIKPECSVHMF